MEKHTCLVSAAGCRLLSPAAAGCRLLSPAAAATLAAELHVSGACSLYLLSYLEVWGDPVRFSELFEECC